MKTTLLPLVILTAAASAQTMPVKSVNRSEQFSVGISYASTSDAWPSPFDNLDTSAMTVDLRATVASNIFLTASFSDMNTNLVIAPPAASDYLDISSYSFGFGTKIAAGNGNLELSYAYCKLDFPYDNLSMNQNIFKVGYTVELGNGFNVGLALIHYLNDEITGSGAFSGGQPDDVTAPVVTVGYNFGQGFSANVSYSTENTVFGGPDADGTMSVGVRYGF